MQVLCIFSSTRRGYDANKIDRHVLERISHSTINANKYAISYIIFYRAKYILCTQLILKRYFCYAFYILPPFVINKNISKKI